MEAQILVGKLIMYKPVKSLLSEIYNHHQDTFRHTVRVALYATALGKYYQFSGEMLENLGLGALLHDTGKCDIELEIIAGKNELNETEHQRIKEHPRHSFLRLNDPMFETARRIAVAHHEFQGKPYPRQGIERRRGSRFGPDRRQYQPLIKAAAELVSAADIYDALSSTRTYKPTWPKVKIIEFMRHEFKGDSRIIDTLESEF